AALAAAMGEMQPIVKGDRHIFFGNVTFPMGDVVVVAREVLAYANVGIVRDDSVRTGVNMGTGASGIHATTRAAGDGAAS
ncbi:MAG: hypothetical protein ACO3SO_12030, partial [Luteolibacter sp.]